ncbi:hypothetical protein GCM10020221_22350 [Streptomyces thioluteus]|uniref:NAD-glutamate dehydrogenase ACT2 domain-containing protein n=1 Tax=Streptomyces thioluteus TaxID=66431 RepID=A0ABN3WU10_STRTU
MHRPSYLDYVGVKKFDADGNVTGERRFLGLFSSAAYTESVRRVPVIRRKVAQVLADAGFSPDSHDGRDLLQILETYPRDELFQTPADQLRSIATSVLYLQERRRLRLYLRRDEYGRYYSALVYLPRDRYTTGVRLRLIDILKEELNGAGVDFTAWNTESVLSRLHFVVRVEPGSTLPELTEADEERIEARLVEAARSWADGFAETLTAEVGEERAAELLRRYSHAFPEGYKADHSPRAAVNDLGHLEKLTTGGRRPRLRVQPLRAGRRGPPASAASRSTARAPPSRSPPSCRCSTAWASRSSTSARTSCAARTGRPPGSTTSVCGCPSTSRATTRAAASRRRSPPSGPAPRRTTTSTSWCCAPASTGARPWCCGPTPSTCGRRG